MKKDSNEEKNTEEPIREENYRTIEKTAKLSSDGKQLFVRFPKKITDNMDIEKGDQVKFTAKLHKEDKSKDQLNIGMKKEDE